MLESMSSRNLDAGWMLITSKRSRERVRDMQKNNQLPPYPEMLPGVRSQKRVFGLRDLTFPLNRGRLLSGKLRSLVSDGE